MLPQPEPAAGTDSYLRERDLALNRSSACRENYALYKAHKPGTPVTYLPVKLDIENVSRCNFHCTMCAVSDWPNQRRGSDMSLGDFKRLIDEQHGLLEIKLQGLGEPLMQGDDFFEMIRYAREKHIWVRTVTNASLLHLKNNHRKLIDSGVNEVQISIDGATGEVFESIRRGSNFERIRDNCRTINRYCRESRRDRTKMWTVVQRANMLQLEDMVRLAAELGFSNQVFSLDVSGWGSETWLGRNRLVDVNGEVDEDRLYRLVGRGHSLGVKVAFWMVGGKYSAKVPCRWPIERAYVSSDMRVVPCCIIANPDTLQIGSAIGPDNSLSDVWFGRDYQAFRRAHETGDIPSACRNCYMGVADKNA